ncbi:MAG: hypothetical protein ABEJ40_04965 [Haloarculaceae archaeon]
MRLPAGRLLRSRVVTDPRTVLVEALDRDLTGYAVLEPQESLLLDEAGAGVLTFVDGVPVVAYHTETDRGGPPALADLAASGPFDLELFALDRRDLASAHEERTLRVPPGMPARRLAGDGALADRTRAAAPPERTTDHEDDREATDRRSAEIGAVEAFLDDEAKIEAIREEAREQARERAEQWNFDVE